MSNLIDRKAALKHIEKTRHGALMIDDIRESSIIMWSMNLLEEAVRNQPSAWIFGEIPGAMMKGEEDD